MSELVDDANELVWAVEDLVEAGLELSDTQGDAVALLALVAGQDVEPGDKPGQWRIIWKSPQLPSDPWTMPTWLPEQMRADVKKAMLDLPKADPKAWQALDPGSPGFAAGNQADYDAIVRMVKANQKQRRSS